MVDVVDPSGFRTLVEKAPDAIVVSRDGIVLYANPAAARQTYQPDSNDDVEDTR